jgi:4-hydroxybenzoate polyprenyltransferase
MNSPEGLITWGAVLSVLGIGGALLLEPTLGGLIVVAGVAIAVYGLHRLGRSGNGQDKTDG